MNKVVSKTIKMKKTLDTRQIAYLVQCAGQFKSDIRITEEEKSINAKSIMGTISLAIKEDDEIKVIASGEDENKALEEICKVLD